MTRADRVIAFIEKYIRVPEGALVGSPIELQPFQIRFLNEVYGNPHGTRRAILSVGRKNGKSALVAALILVHLVGPEAVQNSQLVSGALSRDQASLVFKLAAKMIRLNPELAGLVRIKDSTKELFGLPMGTHFKALAAVGSTAMGLSPVFVLFDELGSVRGPRSDFAEALFSAQAAYENPLTFIISTQAASDTDLLSVLIDDARASQDPRVVCHVYDAPKDCALDDEDAMRAANPAVGVFSSFEDLKHSAEQAMRMPSSEPAHRNLRLNQRCEVGNPFVSRSVWESCGAMPDSLEGLEVWGGLDLSTRTDLTSLVLTGRDSSGIWHVKSFFWTPAEGIVDRARVDRVPYDLWRDQGFLRATPGATVDYEYVARDIAEICDGLDIKAIAFDPHRIDFLKKEFERIGCSVPLVMCHQGFNGVNPGICNLEAELLNKRIAHGMHPLLTMAAAGAVTEINSEGQRRFSKRRSNARIDGIVSLAMCFSAAFKAEEEAPEPTYQMLFL